MNRSALTLSLAMAIIAVFFVQSYVQSIEDQNTKNFGAKVIVIKARKDIREMDTIDETMLETDAVPTTYVEPGAKTFPGKDKDKAAKDPAVLEGKKSLVGTVALVAIHKGEQITFNKITIAGMKTGLSPQITPGKRGFTVPVTETSGVGKLVKPGDRVDLIGVLDSGAGKEGKVAKIVLQDVVVLAVGRNVTNNVPRLLEADPYGGKDRVRSLAEDYTFASVTLEVDPLQAQNLALLLSNGDNSLMLSLRNNDDTDRVNISPSNLVDVLGADGNSKVIRRPGGR